MYLKLTFILAVAVAAVQCNDQLISKTSEPSKNTSLGIFDGQKTTIERHPYLVAIIVLGTFDCAGTIVNQDWVITQADCIYGFAPSDLSVVAGSSDGISGKTFTVSQIVVHPNYGQSPLDYDYACIQLSKKLKWSPKIKPIKLATKNPKPNTPLTVAGWGSTSSSDGAPSNTQLLQGTMKWQTVAVCKSTFEPAGLTYTPRMACAYNKGKTTLCTGDWGDALVKKNVFYAQFLAGLSQDFCTKNASPGLFSSISAVAKWIKTTTGAKLEDEE